MEGSPAADDSFSAAMRPEANIDVVFFSDRGNSGVYWTIGIAAAPGGPRPGRRPRVPARVPARAWRLQSSRLPRV